jgi:hypothetical protein
MTDIQELREQWNALATEDLTLLPKEALIASIRNLAQELLERTEDAVEDIVLDESEYMDVVEIHSSFVMPVDPQA